LFERFTTMQISPDDSTLYLSRRLPA